MPGTSINQGAEIMSQQPKLGFDGEFGFVPDRLFSTQSTTQGKVARYTADLVSSSGYYPFGMQMPGRKVDRGKYRFGFNGMEKETGITSSESHYDFGARIYDSRIGRWLAVDPLAGKYPRESSYLFCGANPIYFVDIDGEKKIVSIIIHNKDGSITTHTTTDENYVKTMKKIWLVGVPNFGGEGTTELTYDAEYDVNIVVDVFITEDKVTMNVVETYAERPSWFQKLFNIMLSNITIQESGIMLYSKDNGGSLGSKKKGEEGEMLESDVLLAVTGAMKKNLKIPSNINFSEFVVPLTKAVDATRKKVLEKEKKEKLDPHEVVTVFFEVPNPYARGTTTSSVNVFRKDSLKTVENFKKQQTKKTKQ